MSDQEQNSPESREALWRARDYAHRHEDSTRPDDQEGLRRTRPRSGTVARQRVPEGRFHVRDMQGLPFDENAFDVVAAFNSLQFTDDPGAALVGARRVAKPGAIVFTVVFGREERVGQVAGWRALGTLLPPRAPGSPGPLALSKPGVINDLVQTSGLTVIDVGYLEGRFDYPDQAAMLRGQRAGQVAVLAERAAGEAAVTDALVKAFASCRTSSDGYRIKFEWRYVVARA
jgi:SAM-dependent methyltransferase